MRVYKYIALVGALQGRTIKKNSQKKNLPTEEPEATTTTSPDDIIDLTMFLDEDYEQKEIKVKTTKATTRATTTARPLPTLPPNYKPIFSDEPEFRSFAAKHQFPPILEEEKVMQRMAGNPRLKSSQNHFASLAGVGRKQTVQCLVCSGQTYEECYRNGTVRQCPSAENSCFLEVRYQGSRVSSVQSGCQQEVACINNMKQNFYDFDNSARTKGPALDAAQATHDCKLFTGHRYGNSVCRNCCFDDMCTDGWQPMSYDEWNISKGSPVEKKMMLFDQFSRPSGFFAEQRAKAFPVQTQVIRDQQNWNNPPTWADLDHQRNQVMNQHQRAKKQPSQRNPKKPHFDKPNSIDLTSYKKPVVVTRRPVTRKITTTRRPTTTTTTTRKPATTRKPLLNRWGRPTQNRPGFQGQARPGFQNRPVQKPTHKPTQKPTTKAISDDVSN